MQRTRSIARILCRSGALSAALLMAGCLCRHVSSDASEESAADGPPQAGFPARAPAVAMSMSQELVSARSDAASRVPVGRAWRGGDAPPSSQPQRRAKLDQMVAHFIDVGQGDAVLLEFSCGAVLIDAGGESTSNVRGTQRLRDYLRAFFLRRTDLENTLKLVVLSHPHKDHTDGVSELLAPQAGIKILNVVDNGATDKGSGIARQRDLQQYVRRSGAGYLGVSESDITSAAGMTGPVIDPVDCREGGGEDPKIVALWGRIDLDKTWANNANNDSVVLRVEFGKSSFLFTGDMEEAGIAAMLASYDVNQRAAFDVDVLKVGHHGSRNATTAELVAAVSPKIAIIQSGDSTLSEATFSAYSYAHPHLHAIQRLVVGVEHGGVSASRPAAQVRVGLKGKNPSTGAGPDFTTMSMDRAIYATGWDGNIAVIAHKDGSLQVQSGY